ncbi:MAG: hypothetical protein ACRD0A_07125, partial [Acidimicrobiales bacterium]
MGEFWEERRRIPRWQGGDGGRRRQPPRYRRLSGPAARSHLRPFAAPRPLVVEADDDDRPPDLDPYEVLMEPANPAFADVGRLLWT